MPSIKIRPGFQSKLACGRSRTSTFLLARLKEIQTEPDCHLLDLFQRALPSLSEHFYCVQAFGKVGRIPLQLRKIAFKQDL
jgi:hypothetical protein